MAVRDSTPGKGPSTSNPDYPSTESCHLLDLPAEIRNTIYRYAVVPPGPLELFPNAEPVDVILCSTNEDAGPIRPSEPTLTKTCRQICTETLPIFYGENAFVDSSYIPDCRKFLLGLTPAKQRMLPQVHVSPSDGYRILLWDPPERVSDADTQAKLEQIRR